jgi:hypothetical protein
MLIIGDKLLRFDIFFWPNGIILGIELLIELLLGIVILLLMVFLFCYIVIFENFCY